MRRWPWSRRPAPTPRSSLRTRSLPSTWSWPARGRPSPRSMRFAGCVFVGRSEATAFGDYAARSTTCCRPAGRGRFQGPLGPATFRAPAGHGSARPSAAPRAGAGGRYAGRGRGLSGARGVRLGPSERSRGKTDEQQPQRRDRAQHEGDEDLPEAEPRRRRGERLDRGRLPRPHARSARLPRALGLEIKAKGDLETTRRHTTEDVGIVLGQAIDKALGDRSGIRRYGSRGPDGRGAGRGSAIDVSGRPMTVYEAELPDVTIADFDTELTEEFFRQSRTTRRSPCTSASATAPTPTTWWRRRSRRSRGRCARRSRSTPTSRESRRPRAR